MGCGNSRGAVAVSHGQAQQEEEQPRPEHLGPAPKLDVVHAPKPPDPTVETWPLGQAKEKPHSWPGAHLTRFPPTQELAGTIVFSTHMLPRVQPMGRDVFVANEDIFLRCFLPTPLCGYCVGTIRIDYSPDYPHHVEGTTIVASDTPERRRVLEDPDADDDVHANVHVVSASRYRKYYLYVDTVTEVVLSWCAEGAPRASHAIQIERSSMTEASLGLPLRHGHGGASSESLSDVFNAYAASLPDGLHMVTLEISFLYQNQSFRAWSDADGAAAGAGVVGGARAADTSTQYYYSDPSRTEVGHSGVVARGTFQLVVDTTASHSVGSPTIAAGLV
eukprot:PhM_4_TR6811/c0_g1_i1/m.8561